MTRTRAEIAPELAAHIALVWCMVDETKTTLAGYEQQLKIAVSKARAEGASWRAIGEALGTSAQAAHERYNFGGKDWTT